MNNRSEPRGFAWIKLLGVIVIIAVCPMVASAEGGRPAKPNVVLLLTDDLGWQDVKCYDIDAPSPFETPHIDGLAKKGVMFWQAYAPAPTCAPSRCAIMSGNHPALPQKTHVVGGAPPVPYNRKHFRMMPPWYSGRMPANELTLARVMQQNGYVTGHSGKWHMAIDHHAFPQPEDQGFDWTRSSRGARNPMGPHRLTGFATQDSGDPYRLDKNGFPFHQNSEDALTFLREFKHKPFFLYYATWLVHTPIHTRARDRLEKYCKKLGVDFPTDPKTWMLEGQQNPYYNPDVKHPLPHKEKVCTILSHKQKGLVWNSPIRRMGRKSYVQTSYPQLQLRRLYKYQRCVDMCSS